jgi:uncharacterized protein YcfL
MKKVTMILAAVVMFAVVSCGAKKTEEVVATDSVVVVEADTTAVDTTAGAGVLEGGEVAPTAEEAVK